MKKMIDIPFKDMVQSFRSLFAIVFMFVVPILMTAMFSLMFGGQGGEDAGFVLPQPDVILVNQDQGSLGGGFATPGEIPQGSVSSESDSIGQLMAVIMASEELSDLINLSQIDDAEQAKAAVDSQKAGVAVILPEDLTKVMLTPGGRGEVEVYQDPTLSIGPAIVKGIVSQVLDGFSGSTITINIALEQLQESGITLSESEVQRLAGQYLMTIQREEPTEKASTVLDIREPQTETSLESRPISALAMMMTGMSIFYVFLTGASTAQTILKEEEEGTLPRLFTTPTPTATILRGKYLAVALTILVQIAVLLVFGYVVFGIQWGGFLPLSLVCLATTLMASAFGIFLISWMESTRQAGFMIGGLVTILGMAGMMPIFTMGMPDQPDFITIVSHLVPQSWAVEALQFTMVGGGLSDISTHILVMLVWSAAFFAVGLIRFRNRYV